MVFFVDTACTVPDWLHDVRLSTYDIC
jgi:hypothetical protein